MILCTAMTWAIAAACLAAIATTAAAHAKMARAAGSKPRWSRIDAV
jgi:hypothetical protein